jgi:hypothetical protein
MLNLKIDLRVYRTLPLETVEFKGCLHRISPSSVLTSKIYVFWDLTPYSPSKMNRRFGGTWIYVQGRITSPACYLLEADFFLGIFLDAEDGGCMFPLIFG